MRFVTVASVAAIVGFSFLFANGHPDTSNFLAPRVLKQASRSEVAARLAGGPDKTHAAKRQGTSPPPSGPCGNPVNGGGSDACYYQPYCSTQLSGTTVVGMSTTSTFSLCVLACDNNSSCGSLSYQFITQECVQFRDENPLTLPNTNYESAIVGECFGG